jgi:hypothetical protein
VVVPDWQEQRGRKNVNWPVVQYVAAPLFVLAS